MEKLHTSSVVPEQINKARQEIIDHLPIEQYLLDKKLIYSSEGKIENKIVCPVHDDNNPSCFYNNEKQTYHCFSCGSKGSVVEMDYGIHLRTNDKESLVKAILRISREYNITIPDMFTLEKKKQAKRVDIKKFNREHISPKQEERIYTRKLERLEELARELPEPIRMTVYANCDKVILGQESAKVMYEKITQFIEQNAQ